MQVNLTDEPFGAVIQGVDDAWEVCLLKFTIDLISALPGAISAISVGAG